MIGLRADVKAAVDWLVQAVQRAGGRLTVTRAVASYQQQEALWLDRASNPYPVARPGTSKHERGLAVDMTVSPRSWQTAVGEAWEAMGGRWGGRFRPRPDPVHFEV